MGLANVLRKATNANVVTAQSGLEAHRNMLMWQWDIVVIDLDMPTLTGLQLIDALAQQGGTGGVVLTSGHQARLVQAAGAYAQFRGVPVLATLEKPLKAGRVRAMATSLAEALQSSRRATLTRKPSASHSIPSSQEILLALDSGSIEGYLQPQHHSDDGRLRGAEVLARWRRLDGTLVRPADFLRALENAGLMGPFTDYMIERAFEAQIRLGWTQDLDISLNVPAYIANSVDWAQSLADRAERAGVLASRLVVEVTEDGDASNLPALTGAITQLRLRGFHCAIDDFGTGHSSLDRLLRVPFNELKIDRHLLHQARQFAHARRILSSTISMARGLGITVVAEGVETDDDKKLVTDMGVQITQGYLHGEAMPLDEFEVYAAMNQFALIEPDSPTATS